MLLESIYQFMGTRKVILIFGLTYDLIPSSTVVYIYLYSNQ